MGTVAVFVRAVSSSLPRYHHWPSPAPSPPRRTAALGPRRVPPRRATGLGPPRAPPRRTTGLGPRRVPLLMPPLRRVPLFDAATAPSPPSERPVGCGPLSSPPFWGRRCAESPCAQGPFLGKRAESPCPSRQKGGLGETRREKRGTREGRALWMGTREGCALGTGTRRSGRSKKWDSRRACALDGDSRRACALDGARRR